MTHVTTDVIPRDDKGRFIPDLTKNDFTVLEDGVAQTIDSFALIHGGRTFNTHSSAAAALRRRASCCRPRRGVRSADSSGRVLLIFVDDLHFEAEYSPHVRRLVTTIVKTLLHEGDLVAMFSSGPSSIEIGLTYDRKLIEASVSKIRGSAMTAAEMFQLLETSQGPGDVRQRAQMAFHAVYGMLGELEQVHNKRKAILYISTGYDFDPFADSRKGRDRIQGGRFAEPTRFVLDEENPYFRLPGVTADIDLHAYMRELTLSANRANASIFTIDPRGLAGIVDAGQHLDQSRVADATCRRHRARCGLWPRKPAASPWSTKTTSSARSSASMRKPATTTCSATIRPTPTRPSAFARSRSRSIGRPSRSHHAAPTR